MRAMLRAESDRWRSYMGAAGLVLLAWTALTIWSVSPYAEWLDHSEIQHIAAPVGLRLAVFTLGWSLMIIAMMLPGTLMVLARCLPNTPFTAPLVAPVILTYMAVWAVFGALSYLGDSVLHEAVEQTPALAGVIAPGVVFLAGIYQFTPLKRACLARCGPDGASFTTLARPDHQSSWTSRLRQAVFCLGSCWALMLLMFALGGVSLIGMLVLGLISAAERLDVHKALVVRTVGILLVLSAGVLAFT